MRRLVSIILLFVLVVLVVAGRDFFWGYYFRHFIYRKDPDYGYLDSINNRLEMFGDRSRSLVDLKAGKYRYFDPEEYVVVVIGDSYVWGQGLKFEDTLPKALERKLAKVRPARVISLAETGDSIVDYKAHYDWAKKYYSHVDLFVFSIVENDLIFNNYDKRLAGLNDEDYGEYFGLCRGQQGKNKIEAVAYTDIKEPDTKYFEFEKASWSNQMNRCVLSNISKDISRENTIFITMMNLYNSDEMVTYKDILGSDRAYITVNDLKTNPSTSRYLKKNADFLLRVLPGDGHPSKLNHELFAELVYRQLLGDRKYNFIR